MNPLVKPLLLLLATWGCGGPAAVVRPPEPPPVEETEDAGESVVMAFSSEMDPEDVPDPNDADEDGFSDDIDLCPALHAVTEDGCPEHLRRSESGADFVLDPPVSFRRNSARMKPSSEGGLNDLLLAMDRNRELRVRVEAHTFQRGSADENMRLSREQATVVSAWLTERGIPSVRLEVYACGKNRPRVSTRGRQRYENRRIELRVISPLPPTGYPSTRGCEEVQAAPVLAAAGATVTESKPQPPRVQAPPPTTPEPEPVAADWDGDGIADSGDRCPRTPGVRSLRGCAKRHRLELESGRLKLLRRVHFNNGAASLKPRAATLLEEVAATLTTNPGVHVRLEVRETNASLAAQRAATLRTWMGDHGVAPERIQAAGCTRHAGKVTIAAAETREQLGALPADCTTAPE